MPEFHAFRGLRYDTAALGAPLDSLVAPPYDVIDESERSALADRHEANAVRLIAPQPLDSGGDRYAAAHALMTAWREERKLVSDPSPRFYGYRMSYTDFSGTTRTTSGVLGALGLPPGGPGTGDVLLHEHTTHKAKSDRFALLAATRANLDPIWLLSTATDLPVGRWDEALGSCVADGVRHELFAIDETELVKEISQSVAAAPAVLADGHHRFETACSYRESVAGTPAQAGADAMLALVVPLVEDELTIQPIHRVVRSGPPDLRDRLARDFEVSRPERPTDVAHEIGSASGIMFVDAAGASLLTPRSATRERVRRAWPATVRDIDAAVVETVVADLVDASSWELRHDATATAAAVGTGDVSAVLLLRAPTVAQTRSAAIAGDRMPAKTTFFAPKLRTGLVFRILDDDAAA